MLEKNPEVSVIVPVYNVEKYLAQCLDSILAQSLAAIEIICIDDGSNDGSGAILDEYAQKDDRMIVIHRQNAGYGSAMNEGIKQASGTYIAFIESDDFIDPHMFKEMLSFSNLKGESHDIVKASYWEFFDGREGVGDIYLRPNMTKMNPVYPCATTLEDNISFIEHHPSIWSALYRREFIEEKGIRFVECPGAGWVDNPFMLETMICAQSIAWVPKEYYCYRQTNEDASTHIKDFHMPLDRIHDLFDIAEKYHAQPRVIEALYVRAFGYIHALIDEYGFDERGPNVREAIGRVIERMDGELVASFEKISFEDRVFFEEWHYVKHASSTIISDQDTSMGAYEFPFVSYVVPISGSKAQLKRFVQACKEAPIDAYEIVFVDEGLRGSLYEEVVLLASKDVHIRLVGGSSDSHAAVFQDALVSARGYYCCILDDLHAYIQPYNFALALLSACDLDVDIMLLDNSSTHLVDALVASGNLTPYQQIQEGSSRLIISHAFQSKHASSFALNGTPLQAPGYVVRCKTMQSHIDDLFYEEDRSSRVILARLLAHEMQMAYAAGVFFDVDTSAPALIKPLLSLDISSHEAVRFNVSHALAIAQDDSIMQTYASSIVTYLLDVFVEDVVSCPDPDALLEYLSLFVEPIGEVLDTYQDSLKMQDNYAYQLYIQARREGVKKLAAALYCDQRVTSYDLAQRIGDLEHSRTFRLGQKIVETGKALHLDQARSVIESLLGRL